MLGINGNLKKKTVRLDGIKFKASYLSSHDGSQTTLTFIVAKPAIDDKLEYVRKIEIPFDYSTDYLDLKPYDIMVEPGYSIAPVGVTLRPADTANGVLAISSYAYSNGSPYPNAPKCNYFTPTAKPGDVSALFNSPLVLSYELSYSVLIPRDSNEIITNEININDLTTVMFTGSSLTSSHYQPAGSSFIERLNDLTDLNIVNNAITSKNLMDNINAIINNDVIAKDAYNKPSGG